MASWDDVRRVAAALPETREAAWHDGLAVWRVGPGAGTAFAHDRPLRPGDLRALGDAAPTGPILAARLPDLEAKEALLAQDPDVFFTIPHFDGYKAILVRLERIEIPDLQELLVEAWLARAPKRLVREHGPRLAGG